MVDIGALFWFGNISIIHIIGVSTLLFAVITITNNMFFNKNHFPVAGRVSPGIQVAPTS